MTTRPNSATSILVPAGRSDQRGYTLVEALTVIVVIGIMAGIALPKNNLTTYKANAAAQVVATTLSYAQRQAISRQADTRVAFDAVNNEIRIHEDQNNDNVIDLNERVTTTALPDGITFGRGAAAARPMGVAPINFTRTQGLLPMVVFRRDGSASENGGVYLTTIDGLSIGRTADVRAVEVSRATGRAGWYSFGTGAWKEGR